MPAINMPTSSPPASSPPASSLLLRCALAAAVLAVAACGEPPPDVADPANTDPARTMSAEDGKAVTASYQCDDGHRIDVIRDNVARLALADGRVIKLEVIEGSTPRTFTDHGLTLLVPVGDGTPTLEDEKGRLLKCGPIG